MKNLRNFISFVIPNLRKRPYLLIGVFLIIFVLFTQTPFFRQREALQTYKVEKKELLQLFTASGTIEPSKKATLHFQTPGKVVWIGVKEGDSVYAWQGLASLDTTELQASFRQAEKDFIAAKAELEKVYDETGRKVDESFSEKIKRTASEAKHDKAYDEMKKIEKRMQDASLVSPINGVVVKIGFNQGENVTVVDTIEIVNPASFRFKADLDETDFANISLDQKVRITLDAYKGKELFGKVVQIGSATEVSQSGASTIPVEIDIEDSKLSLIAGLSGEAEFIQTETKNILVVTKKAIIYEGKDTYIYVIKGRTREKRKVSIGLQTEKEAQILSGLEAGETILVGEFKNERR